MKFASNRARWLVPISVLMFALALRTWGLGVESLWYDEGYTAMLVRGSWFELPRLAAARELNTPLHYLVLAPWVSLTGSSEFAGRYFSALAGMLCVALALSLRQTLSSVAAGSASVLIAISPVLVLASRELRMYELASTLAFASIVLGLRAMRGSSSFAISAWVVMAIAAFATHVLAAFVVLAEVLLGLTALWWSRGAFGARRWLVASGAITVCVVGWIVWLLTFAGGYGTNFGARLDFVGLFVDVSAAVIYPGEATTLTRVLGVSLQIVILFGVARSLARNQQERRAKSAMVWFGTVELIALIGVTALCAFTGKFAPRYASIVTAPALVALPIAAFVWVQGVPCLRLRPQLLASSVTAGLALIWAGLIWGQPGRPNEDFRGAATYIQQHIQDDEVILLVSGHFAPVFEYYYGDVGWRALPADPVLNLASVLDYSSTVSALNEALAGKRGAWLLEWQAGVIDPTQLTDQFLRRQSPQFEPTEALETFAGLTLKHFRFNGAYQPLPNTLPLTTAVVEDRGARKGLSSPGCAQLQAAKLGQGYLEVGCMWRLAQGAQLPWDTKVSLRVFNASGEKLAQLDQNLLEHGLPSQPFAKDLLGLYRIEMPETMQPGEFELQVLPYVGNEELSPRLRVTLKVVAGD